MSFYKVAILCLIIVWLCNTTSASVLSAAFSTAMNSHIFLISIDVGKNYGVNTQIHS